MQELHFFFFYVGNFPWLVPILATISQWGAREKAIKLFYDTVERIIQERRQGKDSEKVYFQNHYTIHRYIVSFPAAQRPTPVDD